MNQPFAKHWTGMVSMAGHPGGSHCSPNKTLQHTWSLPKTTLTLCNTAGKSFTDRWNRDTVVWEEHAVRKHHPNNEVWWRLSWFGAALQPLDLDSLALTRGKNSISVYQGVLQYHVRLAVRCWSSGDAGWWTKTQLTNTVVNLPPNQLQL